MTDIEKTRLNYFFVKVFNQILSWEEQSFKNMGITEISLRELHVIEAVYSLLDKGENKMSEIAKLLSITPGSLTTAVGCLVKKGYLTREHLPADRRVVMIVPTPKADKVNKLHEHFHRDMIDEITKNMKDTDILNITNILETLDEFFESKDNLRR